MSFLAWPAANSMPGTARILLDALRAQPVEPVADDRLGEFQIAVLNGVERQLGAELARDHREFAARRQVSGCRGRTA